MIPSTYDLKLYRGDTAHYRFKLWDDLAKTQPTNLQGATGKAEVRTASGGTLIKSLGVQITLPNTVDVSVAVSDWTSWTQNTGVWDLQLTYGNGEVVSPVAGHVHVTGDVTNP